MLQPGCQQFAQQATETNIPRDFYTAALRSIGAWAVIGKTVGDLHAAVNDWEAGCDGSIDSVGGDAGHRTRRGHRVDLIARTQDLEATYPTSGENHPCAIKSNPRCTSID